MLHAIVFDLDGTLYDYDPAHAAGFAAVTAYAVERFGLTPEDFRALHREGDRVLRAHAGESVAAIHSRLLRYQLMCELLGQPITHAPRMAEAYWTAFLREVKPEPGTRETLLRLRKLGYRVGVGTNMTAGRQYEKLELLGLLEVLDFLVTSEEVSVEKPDARLFALCAQKAGCEAARCLFVGDDAEKDVWGAQRAGMQTVYLARKDALPELPAETALLRRVSELPDLLERRDHDAL